MTKWRISEPHGGIYAIYETADPRQAAYAFVQGWRVEMV